MPTRNGPRLAMGARAVGGVCTTVTTVTTVVVGWRSGRHGQVVMYGRVSPGGVTAVGSVMSRRGISIPEAPRRCQLVGDIVRAALRASGARGLRSSRISRVSENALDPLLCLFKRPSGHAYPHDFDNPDTVRAPAFRRLH